MVPCDRGTAWALCLNGARYEKIVTIHLCCICSLDEKEKPVHATKGIKPLPTTGIEQ